MKFRIDFVPLTSRVQVFFQWVGVIRMMSGSDQNERQKMMSAGSDENEFDVTGTSLHDQQVLLLRSQKKLT